MFKKNELKEGLSKKDDSDNLLGINGSYDNSFNKN